MTFPESRFPRPSRGLRHPAGILLTTAWITVVTGVSVATADTRGWTYLMDKLQRDGVPREYVLRVFRDPRMRAHGQLDFGLYPGESSRLYRGFRSRSSIARARRCRVRYAGAFESAARRFKVPASVVASIFHVETSCGENKGKDTVLYRLARLAMANEPKNVERNVRRHQKGEPRERWPRIEARTRERGVYLEQTFYPEVLAGFQIGTKLRIDPLGIVGSKAGAFGIPQFLPSSYLRFGVDGNGDGRVSLHDPADAAHSAAHYLAQHGWRPGISTADKRQVIWSYNRSDAYIDTILFLADQIERRRN